MSGWWEDFVERENKRRIDEIKRESEELKAKITQKAAESHLEYVASIYKPYAGKCPDDCN
jgi:hypothetical protein